MSTFHYEGDLLSTIEDDLDGDGEIEAEWRYTYDDQGRSTELAGDDGPDGTVDQLMVTVFTDGPTSTDAHVTFDAGVDGNLEWIQDYTYDAERRLLHQSYDAPADGVIDFEETLTWDLVGGVVLTEDRMDSDGVWHIEHTYDAEYRRIALVSVFDDGPGGADLAEEEHTWVFGGTCP